jgi:hypothetical protein
MRARFLSSNKFFPILCSFFSLCHLSAQVSVWTHHNDNYRSGANLNEIQLNTSTVNANSFGKLFSYSVDASVYAQPLYLSNISIPGKGTRNVLYVATMNDSVYAFDADTNVGGPLWFVNFTNPSAGITAIPGTDIQTAPNVSGSVGILGTPVIDTAAGTIFLVARTKENGAYVQRLHALDVTSGAERPNSPLVIQASVPGTGYDGVGGTIQFNPKTANQRSGLTLANGKLVIAWGGLDDDFDPYHGWVMTFDPVTLQRLAVFNTSPNGRRAGIWESGSAAPVDAYGNVYYTTGNGSWDGVTEYGDTMLRLDPSNGLALSDWFTPDDQQYLDMNDLDLGVSGPMVLPGTDFLLGGSKVGILYLLNVNKMGHLVAGNGQITQTLQAAKGHIHGSPVYYASPSLGPLIYLRGENDYLKAFHFNGSTLDPAPIMETSQVAPPGMPGGILSISARGNQPGTGILWVAEPLKDDAETQVVGGILRAFDASNLSHELWNSNTNAARDSVGNFGKFSPPTVANGRVYLSTFSNVLHVYGLIGSVTASGSLRGALSKPSATQNLTQLGTADWAHWGLNSAASFDAKAGGQGQISNYTLVGSGQVAQYDDHPFGFTWSDGIPTATATKSSTGVYVSGIQNGFQITAPADTTSRTLSVYVSVWMAGSKLVAHLSDGSAFDFVDSSLSNPNGNTAGLYTLTYRAASSGQKLVVTFTQATDAGGGNVALQAATLSGAANPDFTVTASPSIQSVLPGASTSYNVTVAGQNGYSGTVALSVTGLPAGSTATCTPTSVSSAGSSSLVVATTPGTVPGTYPLNITATAGSISHSAAVTLTIADAASGGVLSGVLSNPTGAQDLGKLGTSDWAHWGLTTPTSFDHKASGQNQISSYTITGSGPAYQYADNPFGFSWTGGSPTASATASKTGVYVAGLNQGFRITVPADLTIRTLSVYVGVWMASGKLTAHLSDGSAPDFVNSSLKNSAGTTAGLYTITYHAATAGQKLVVTFTQTAGATGNVTLQAAALASK